MKKVLIVLILFYAGMLTVLGQKKDTLTKEHFPKHYFSINPINTALIDQAGISYEYKPGIFGFGIAAGYKYAGKRNYSRLLIAASIQHGAYEFYTGFYAIPQFNVYFYKPKESDRGTLVYFALKGVYKNLNIDSTGFYIWENNGYQDWYYVNQVDHVNIIGVFGNLGIKVVRKHFFFDINFGPGIFDHGHTTVCTGVKHYYGYTSTTDINPPHKSHFHEKHFTVNISINFGGNF